MVTESVSGQLKELFTMTVKTESAAGVTKIESVIAPLFIQKIELPPEAMIVAVSPKQIVSEGKIVITVFGAGTAFKTTCTVSFPQVRVESTIVRFTKPESVGPGIYVGDAIVESLNVPLPEVVHAIVP